jgi:superfamily II DNA helicase RecQ
MKRQPVTVTALSVLAVTLIQVQMEIQIQMLTMGITQVISPLLALMHTAMVFLKQSRHVSRYLMVLYRSSGKNLHQKVPAL